MIWATMSSSVGESTAAGDTPPLLDWRGRVVQDDAWAGEVDVSSPPAQRAAGMADVFLEFCAAYREFWACFFRDLTAGLSCFGR